MIARAIATRILNFGEDILLLTHDNADGDTLGSARALCLALRQMGKRVRVENGGEIPSRLKFLIPDDCEHFEPKTVVSVDVAAPHLLGDKLLEKYGDRVNLMIDHHSSHTVFAKSAVIDSSCAACGELVYQLILELGVTVTPEMARALYSAIANDTGCFRYANTTAQTHSIAAELMRVCGDVSDLNYIFFTQKSAAQIFLEKCTYDNLEPAFDGRVMMSYITLSQMDESGGEPYDRGDLPNIPRSIEGVELAVLFKQEEKEKWNISVRTNGGKLNAGEVCARFGGGGHKGAGGGEFFGSIEEAKSAFCKALEEFL